MSGPMSPALREVLNRIIRTGRANRELAAALARDAESAAQQVAALRLEVAQLRDTCRSCAGFGGTFDSPGENS